MLFKIMFLQLWQKSWKINCEEVPEWKSATLLKLNFLTFVFFKVLPQVSARASVEQLFCWTSIIAEHVSLATSIYDSDFVLIDPIKDHFADCIKPND